MNKKALIITGVVAGIAAIGTGLWYWLVYTPSLTTQQQMTGTPTAGGGYNNPGNLRSGLPVYNGEVDNNGAAFRWFEDMPHGLRAIIVLYRYYYGTGKTTLTQCINTYAPPSDGNDTTAYINTVATATGVDPNADINSLLYTQAGAVSLMKAVTKVEQGSSFVLSDDDCNAAYNDI